MALASGEVIVYQREAGKRGAIQFASTPPLWSGDVIVRPARFNHVSICVIRVNHVLISSSYPAGSFWDPQSSQTLVLGTPSSPVTKMVPVGGKLWCGSQNRVLIINTTTLVQEVCRSMSGCVYKGRGGGDADGIISVCVCVCVLCRSQHWFQVGTDSSRCVTCMVAYGQGVWLALQGSAQVKLYHAQTLESLTEVDVAPAVHKMLAGKTHMGKTSTVQVCMNIIFLIAARSSLFISQFQNIFPVFYPWWINCNPRL